jgi:hypothetical protein
MLEGIMSDFNEWVRNERAHIETALELAVIDWLKAQDVGFDDSFINLNGNHHGLAGTGKNKGKVSYCGSIQNNAKGVPYATCTVSFRRASEPNRTFSGNSHEVVRQMWEDYKAGNTHTLQKVSKYQRDLADEQKRREAKAKTEAAQKSAQPAILSRLAKADETVCIERDYVGIDLLKHRTLLIEGGMGTGKTEWLKNTLAGLKPKGIKSVLCIYPRIALAKNSSVRLSIEYYEDIEIISMVVEFGTDVQLSAVSNSLKRLGLTGDERFDVVVMDEIELNIQHIFGETFDKPRDLRSDTLQILRGLVKNANYFVGMQAQITQLSYDFLRFCGRVDDAYLIRNTYQRYKGHPVAWFGSKEGCIKQLKDWLDKGEPCIVACMSANFLKDLRDDLKARYPNERIEAVYSDNKGDPRTRAILDNPDIAKPLALLHTPVIDMGVSIENGWFKHGVGFCHTGTKVGTPDSFTQMMFRARHLRDHAIFVERQTYDNPTDYVKILQDEIASYSTTGRTIEYLADGGMVLERTQRAVVTPADILRAKNKAAENAGKNNAVREVYRILMGMGCDVVKPEDVPDKAERDEIRADLQAAKERVKADDMAAIIAAPAITSKQFEDLRRSNENTSEDVAKVKRHLMEKSLAISLPSQGESEIKEVFDFWDDGRGKGKLILREMMALPKRLAVAYAEKLYVAGIRSQFIVKWLLLSWVLEVFGGRFDNDGRLEGDGDWVSYDDFRGHKIYEWVKANREIANLSGLINIRGNEPDEREIGKLIKATGLPVETKRVDENIDQSEVSNSDDGNGGQKSVPNPPSNTLLYKNMEGGSAQKSDHRQKRERVSVFTIDKTTTLIPPNPTDSVVRRVFDGIMVILAMLVGARLLDDGRLEVNKDAAFRLDDLRQGDWYDWVLANKALINKAKLGAQIKGDAPTDKALGLWLRKFGFKLVSKRVDKGSKAKSKAEKGDRTQVRFYRLVPSEEPEFIRENLARRVNNLYYAKAAQEWLDQKAQEVAEFGTELLPDIPVSPATARLTIRFGILHSLHIRSDGQGGLKCDPPRLRRGDFVFRFEDLKSEYWYDFACKHKEAVNKAGLGAQFNGDAPSVQVLTAWIKAMGIELNSKRIDVRKLLIDKGVEYENVDNSGGDPLGSDKGEAVDQPNKTVMVQNNTSKNSALQSQKREFVRVYSVRPKCLQKVREILDNDEHERENELIAHVLDEAKTALPAGQGTKLQQLDEFLS